MEAPSWLLEARKSKVERQKAQRGGGPGKYEHTRGYMRYLCKGHGEGLLVALHSIKQIFRSRNIRVECVDESFSKLHTCFSSNFKI